MRITIANIKGGVGKSTLAKILSQKFNLPVRNLDSYQDPTLFGDIKEATEKSDSWIADTGGYLGKDLKKTIEESDLVIVPTLPSVRDIVATASFLEWLLPFYKGKVLIVANQSNEKEAQEVMEALKEALGNIDYAAVEDIRFTRIPSVKSVRSWDLQRSGWMDHLKVWNRSQKKAAEHINTFCRELEEWIAKRYK